MSEKGASWVCNECGAHEYSAACVSENDLRYLACGSCGCDEFHREPPRMKMLLPDPPKEPK